MTTAGERRAPRLVVIGGPNGAGKSTVAPLILRESLEVDEFVNADVIASGLSSSDPESVAFGAGRMMLQRIRELAAQRADFAFETTLASRTFAPKIRKWIADSYAFHLVYVWIPSPEFAIQRVHQRVRSGGHAVPDEAVERRYWRSLRNFRDLYRPLCLRWHVYNNLQSQGLRRIASGDAEGETRVDQPDVWNQISSHFG